MKKKKKEFISGSLHRHGNYFVAQKYVNAGNGVYMFESTRHVYIHVTVRWGTYTLEPLAGSK
jgi:hypothetical protein